MNGEAAAFKFVATLQDQSSSAADVGAAARELALRYISARAASRGRKLNMNGAAFAMFRWHDLTHRHGVCAGRPALHHWSCLAFRWQAGRR